MLHRRLDGDPDNAELWERLAARYANQLRAVEVNYTVSNGRTGAEQRTQQMSFVVSMPNTGEW